jgi:hypothetical protein
MNYDHDLGIIDTLSTLDTTIAPLLGSASNSLTIIGTGALKIPVGTTAQQPIVGIGQIRYDSDTNKLRWSNNSVWADLSTGGTVTSVGLLDSSVLPIYTITNSPIVSSGSLTMTLNTQLANQVFAAPNGSTGQPSFRALVSTDIPSLGSIYLPLSGGSMVSGGTITMSGGGTITGLPTQPVNSTDAASKAYVDASASGLLIHTAVESASIVAYVALYNNGTAGVGATLTNNGTLSVFSIDSYSAPVGARVLIKNQVDPKQNGIYIVTNVGSISTSWVLTRAGDYDNSIPGEARAGSFVFVSEGTTLLKSGWVETAIGTGTNDDIQFGTDDITFTQFSGAGTYTASLPLLVTGGSNFTISGLSTYGTANQLMGMNNAAGSVEYKTVSGSTNQITISNSPNSIIASIASDVVLPGVGAMTVVSGITGTEPAAGGGKVRYDTTTNKLRWSSNIAWADIGTVSDVSITTANGVSGTVATSTSTPAITLVLGAITPTSVNGNTITTGTGTLTLGAGKTLTVNNSIALSGTDGTTMTFPSANASIARTDAGQTFTGVQVMTSPSLTTPVINGISSGTGVAITPTINTLMQRNLNGNAFANNFVCNLSSSPTTGGTSPLFVESPSIREYTGTLSETVVLPLTAALTPGHSYTIINRSTGVLTVQSSGGDTVQTIAPNSSAYVVCVVNSGTTAASWDSVYTTGNVGTVTSVGLTDASTSPIFNVTNSPVTTTGTLTLTLQTQTTGKVLAAPNGSTGQPTFRALVQADLTFLRLYKENTATVTVPNPAGVNSAAIGSGSNATADNTVATGEGSNARVWGSKTYANGQFTAIGDAQSGMYILRNITTNNTPTVLYMDGVAATQRLLVTDNSVWTFKILVCARRTDATGGGAAYSFEGAIRKDGPAASLTTIGSVSKVIIGETNVAWDAAVTVDTTNGALQVTVTGELSKTIRWVATVITSEVVN